MTFPLHLPGLKANRSSYGDTGKICVSQIRGMLYHTLYRQYRILLMPDACIARCICLYCTLYLPMSNPVSASNASLSTWSHAASTCIARCICQYRTLYLPESHASSACIARCICQYRTLYLTESHAVSASIARCICLNRTLYLPVSHAVSTSIAPCICLNRTLYLPVSHAVAATIAPCICLYRTLPLPVSTAVFACMERCICLHRVLYLFTSQHVQRITPCLLIACIFIYVFCPYPYLCASQHSSTFILCYNRSSYDSNTIILIFLCFILYSLLIFSGLNF